MIAGFNILNIVLILAGLAVGWVVLKFLFRLTTRIACGCIGLISLGVIIWLIVR
jgi:hypothetical protein